MFGGWEYAASGAGPCPDGRAGPSFHCAGIGPALLIRIEPGRTVRRPYRPEQTVFEKLLVVLLVALPVVTLFPAVTHCSCVGRAVSF